jgi:hypothetical protein
MTPIFFKITIPRKMIKNRAPETGTQINVRLQPADLAALDVWRKDQPDLPTRPEALRRLATHAMNGWSGQCLRDLIRTFLSTLPPDYLENYINENETPSVDAAMKLFFDIDKKGHRSGGCGGLQKEAENVGRELFGYLPPMTDPKQIEAAAQLKSLLKKITED